ncbi:MAG: TIGR02444 family protein [Pseudomonadota bacterium]
MTQNADVSPVGFRQALANEERRFWRAAKQFYAVPGGQGVCLYLQDRLNLNVNVVLYIMWRACAGDLLNRERITLVHRVAALQCAEKVRNLRWAIKNKLGADHPLYEEAKRVELAAEKDQQRLILATDFPERAEAQTAQVGLSASSIVETIQTYIAQFGTAKMPGDDDLNTRLSKWVQTCVTLDLGD